VVEGAYTTHASTGRRRRISTLRLVAAAAVAAVLVGGYQEHWSWTGISGNTATLWDWISLLLLPITVATLPIWLSRRHALGSRRKAAGMALLAVFAAVVMAGYLVPWGWTGFEGNALWDWINLLLLPLVVATFPVWPEIRQELRLHHHLLLIVMLVAFAVAVFGGYVWGWAWTGFQGNTLWDWLHLLVLPLVFPTLLLPAALAITAGELMQEESQAPDSASIAH
jgi:hypothetical protein